MRLWLTNGCAEEAGHPLYMHIRYVFKRSIYPFPIPRPSHPRPAGYLLVICVHAAWHRKGVYEPITLLNLKQPCPDRVVRPLIFPPRVCIVEFRCCDHGSQEKRKEGRRQAKGRSSSPPPLAAGQRRLCHEGNFNLYSVQTRGKVSRPGKEDAQIIVGMDRAFLQFFFLSLSLPPPSLLQLLLVF